MSLRLAFFPLLLCALLSGCVAASQGQETQWFRYEICFGLSKDQGATVITQDEWESFVDQEIVPTFPDGFTILGATGYWREQDATYREGSKVLMVVAPGPKEERLTTIKALADAYKERFRQDSVLIIAQPADVTFQ